MMPKERTHPDAFDLFWAQVRLANYKLKVLKQNKLLKKQLPELQKQIEHILSRSKNKKRPFVFAPGLSWHRQLFQRPQQLALALANLGETVFYLDPLDENSISGEIEQLKPSLFRIAAPPTVLKNVLNPYLYLLTWSYSPAAYLQPVDIIYDIVDDFSTFAVDQSLIRYQHAQRMQNARLVIATAKRLENMHRSARSDLLYIPNAVDFAHFNQGKLSIPEDIQHIIGKRTPIIGYHGAFAEWFDYKLLFEVAVDRKHNSIILIGPDDTHQLQNSELLDLSNVFWLGKKKYEALPAYLQCFDVAIIPFIINKITHATSPIKLFEYMAGAKPVVVTPMEESQIIPGVLTATTSEGFSKAIDQALKLKNKQDFTEALVNVARSNTWSARAAQILDSL